MDFNLNNVSTVANPDRASDRKFLAEMRKNVIGNWKKLSVLSMICLTLFPLIFISVGILYRSSCLFNPKLPFFLLIFGCLILINLILYVIVGTTSLALIRRPQSLSPEKGTAVLTATLSAMIFGIITFVWWMIGTVWWIQLSLNVGPHPHQSPLPAFCHPTVYWTTLVANVFGLVGFILQICMATGGSSQKQIPKNRGG